MASKIIEFLKKKKNRDEIAERLQAAGSSFANVATVPQYRPLAPRPRGVFAKASGMNLGGLLYG